MEDDFQDLTPNIEGKVLRCSICERRFKVTEYFWGHNPYPMADKDHKIDSYETLLKETPKERCCGLCNEKIVKPARLSGHKGWKPEPNDPRYAQTPREYLRSRFIKRMEKLKKEEDEEKR